MKKSVVMVTLAVMMGYYIFASGLVFELTKSMIMGSFDTPYSIAFSNDRIGFVGIFTDDDVACAKWLAYETDPESSIWVDYLGMSLMIDYTGYDRGSYEEPSEEHYLLFTSWNTESKLRVYGWYEGTREYTRLPDLENYKEVYRQGETVVYKTH
jgi:hypothetical protein